MVWEVAELCADRALGGVFAEADLKTLLAQLAPTFVGRGKARVGRLTRGV